MTYLSRKLTTKKLVYKVRFHFVKQSDKAKEVALYLDYPINELERFPFAIGITAVQHELRESNAIPPVELLRSDPTVNYSKSHKLWRPPIPDAIAFKLHVPYNCVMAR